MTSMLRGNVSRATSRRHNSSAFPAHGGLYHDSCFSASVEAKLRPVQAARSSRTARLSVTAFQHGQNGSTSTNKSPPVTGGLEGALSVRCKLVVPYHPTHHGQQLVLVGDCPALGSWDVKKGLEFKWCEGHSHVLEADLPIHSPIACKLVVRGENNAATWEPEGNRELLLAPSSLAGRAAGYTVFCHWGYPECTQVLANSLRRGTTTNGAKVNGAAKPKSNGSSSPLRFMPGSVVIPGITTSWDDLSASGSFDEADDAMVQCQVNVLVPRNGPKLKPEQTLVLVGSSPALGRWDPAQGLPLERVSDDHPMWATQAELPLGDGLQAKVVVVDMVTGKAQTWEPCENRSLARLGGSSPAMITAYWGTPETHCIEVDKLSTVTVNANPQVVSMLRQQLAATTSQLDGVKKERDDARQQAEQLRHLEAEIKSAGGSDRGSRFEMVQLAEQLQTTRRLYETTKKEANELGGAVGVTRQLCDAAKRELASLAKQLDSAKRAYEALAPEVERMEKKLASTTRAFEATKPEVQALEAQLERARGLFDRTLQKIEAAKALTSSGEFDSGAFRRRADARIREPAFAKH